MKPRDEVVPGVYVIRCTATGEVYVGSSIDTHKRMQSHRHWLVIKIHHNVKMQTAWNKYGRDAFVFELLEESYDVDNLHALEAQWIEKLGGHFNEKKRPGRLAIGAGYDSYVMKRIRTQAQRRGKL